MWAIGALTAAAAYYAIVTPFFAWSAGSLGYYAPAVGLSVALGLAAMFTGVLTVIKLRGPRRDV